MEADCEAYLMIYNIYKYMDTVYNIFQWKRPDEVINRNCAIRAAL